MTNALGSHLYNSQIFAREDGGARLTSPELPNLILSGNDLDSVLATVPDAVEILLSHQGVNVIAVRPAESISDVVADRSDTESGTRRFIIVYAA